MSYIRYLFQIVTNFLDILSRNLFLNFILLGLDLSFDRQQGQRIEIPGLAEINNLHTPHHFCPRSYRPE